MICSISWHMTSVLSFLASAGKEGAAYRKELLGFVLFGDVGDGALGAVDEVGIDVEGEGIAAHAPTPTTSSATTTSRHFEFDVGARSGFGFAL